MGSRAFVFAFAFLVFTGAAAGLSERALVRGIVVVGVRPSAGRIRYVLYLFYLFYKHGPPADGNRPQNRVSFDSRVETPMVVDSCVPTILGTRIGFNHRVPESSRFLNFDLP